MGVVDKVYKGLFRRTSTFAFVCLGTAFMFERGFDLASNAIFYNINKGKLWRDIKDSCAQE